MWKRIQGQGSWQGVDTHPVSLTWSSQLIGAFCKGWQGYCWLAGCQRGAAVRPTGPALTAGFPPLLHLPAAFGLLHPLQGKECAGPGRAMPASRRHLGRPLDCRGPVSGAVPRACFCADVKWVWALWLARARIRRARNAPRARGGPGVLGSPALLTGGSPGPVERAHGALAPAAPGRAPRRPGVLARAAPGSLQVCARAELWPAGHGCGPAALCLGAVALAPLCCRLGIRSSPWEFPRDNSPSRLLSLLGRVCRGASLQG